MRHTVISHKEDAYHKVDTFDNDNDNNDNDRQLGLAAVADQPD